MVLVELVFFIFPNADFLNFFNVCSYLPKHDTAYIGKINHTESLIVKNNIKNCTVCIIQKLFKIQSYTDKSPYLIV